MSWEDWRDNAYRLRNVIRRGYLLGTSSKGKMLQARVRTGDGIENDNIDIMHPVGFASRLPAGPKVEVITADVNADASKRVVLAVVGNRADIPSVEEGEATLYSPGDPKKKITASKSGGISMDSDDKPTTMTTKDTVTMTAEKGAKLFDGIEIDKDGNVTFTKDVVFKGNVTIEKDLEVKGSVKVGGSVVVTGTVTAAGFIDS